MCPEEGGRCDGHHKEKKITDRRVARTHGALRDSLMALIIERGWDQTSVQDFGFVRGLIEHAHGNQLLFRAVIGKRSGLVVQRHFRQLLIELVAEDLAGVDLPAVRCDAAAHYIAGVLFELLTWWIDSRSPLAPRDSEAIFRELTTPVLGAIRSG